ncbi:coproporphyrinogen iii oxidase : Coproporphyrinogen III oxidase OS=Blastopirellula marina DSM 3645 GN=DSM3645_20187 PE=4 SV=1: Radical_SAM [Gemmata massiliana]|uniref:Radical SAM core domain-containing protein n=1 Tax=Gemmata massiliana TaxID=1210884 RepID=A0A6P2D2K0_9BACT|nr:coproporphyrinogen-III oxidase family protein [Gemmata massiliana]VTR94786.1 coproporphyrinogen iii oxidase : Coproporphyrinogen III oxidase OS=Blastopirellula marina DSM 3645 GN=DSM3645_20187 PE=4 SV=1: Radical_SAM [Gemmata massiliana]
MTVSAAEQEKTGLGNYFIANYPQFSFWNNSYLPDAQRAINSPPRPGVPLGLYLHIPFCRKRCKFCYFRVYTDKNASDISVYLDAITKEVELLSKTACVGGRPLDYVYFGGGTPSYLSATQLDGLMTRLRKIMPWDSAREITFECEPGTLQKHKLEMLRKHGVTRLSLGVENFKPEILQYNGRAHLEEEIYRAFGWARELGFPQINLDLIAGMVGEDWDNWKQCVEKTIKLGPDCVTIYQMELPYNTVFSKELKVLGNDEPALAVADWPTKRAWTRYAFDELVKAGYEVSSATTVVKSKAKTRFVYREALWRGADMFGTGVASFGHVNGVHIQNVDTWEAYVARLDAGELPLGRAFPTAERDRLIREIVLLLKTGHLDVGYFRDKYQVDIRDEFRAAFEKLESDGWLNVTGESIDCTPDGLIQIDRHLPTFFDPQYISSRYT